MESAANKIISTIEKRKKYLAGKRGQKKIYRIDNRLSELDGLAQAIKEMAKVKIQSGDVSKEVIIKFMDFEDVVSNFIGLLHLGSVFDVQSRNAIEFARGSRDKEKQLLLSHLSEGDVDIERIVKLASLLTEHDDIHSHEHALLAKAEHLRKFLDNENQMISTDLGFTYADVKNYVTNIAKSGYFSAIPEPALTGTG